MNAALPKLSRLAFEKLVDECDFEVVEVGELLTAQQVLESPKQVVVGRRKVRRIRRM